MVYDNVKEYSNGVHTRSYKEINIPASINKELNAIGKGVKQISDAADAALLNRVEDIKKEYKKNIDTLEFLKQFEGINSLFDNKVNQMLVTYNNENVVKEMGKQWQQAGIAYVYSFIVSFVISLFVFSNTPEGFKMVIFGGFFISLFLTYPILFIHTFLLSKKAKKYVHEMNENIGEFKYLAFEISNCIKEFGAISNEEDNFKIFNKIKEFIANKFGEDNSTTQKEYIEQSNQEVDNTTTINQTEIIENKINTTEEKTEEITEEKKTNIGGIILNLIIFSISLVALWFLYMVILDVFFYLSGDEEVVTSIVLSAVSSSLVVWAYNKYLKK